MTYQVMPMTSRKIQIPPTKKRQFDPGLLLAWYGDDFTGAAAVMEVLAFSGLPTMLFLDVPTPEQIARFPELRAVGVASTARAEPPEWMSENLPTAFRRLGELGPQLVHYKVCSTLDSSPQIGSIGRAAELGAACFSTSVIPVVVAAPQMRRYQCFGHLFAGFGDDILRLDRHPVMSRHPVTPMTESDVALHISRQSDKIDTALLSLDMIGSEHYRIDTAKTAAQRLTICSMDTTDAVSDAAVGQAIWDARAQARFVIGSQGIEFALVEYWQQSGRLDAAPLPVGIGRSERMMSVSGSVSPTTADQINWSKNNGFAGIELDAALLCQGDDGIDKAIDQATSDALSALSNGHNPLVYTAAGPDDVAVARFKQAIEQANIETATANRIVGEALGRVLHSVLIQGGVRRAVVSGGDTSGFATRQLGIYALSALAPTIPGASICQAHADGPMDGLELALKGGQMGSPDYFGWVRDGGGAR